MIAYSSLDIAVPPMHMDGDAFLNVLKCIVLAPIMIPWYAAFGLWFVNTTFMVVLPRVYRWMVAKLKGRCIESLRLKKAEWTIHGRQYDLTAFAKKHPGGTWALELGRNRDCTCLFESYHVFSDMSKLEKILAQYETPESKKSKIKVQPTDNSTGLVFRDEFHEAVKQMAKDHFKDGKSHKSKPWIFWLVILVIICFAIGLYGMVRGYIVAFMVMPFLGAFLTFNVSHDASHFAWHGKPILNSIFAFTSSPMFFNSTAWYIQHIVQHHVYTNDELDVDLYHFLPACRTSRFTKFASTFRLQWLLIWLVLPTTVAHLCFVVPLDIVTRAVDHVTKMRRYQQCNNIDDFVAGCRGWILLEFTLSLGYAFLVIGMNGLLKGTILISLSYSVSSMLFIICTQGAHLNEGSMISKESEDFSWAKRQVLTSVNFRVDSFWCYLMSGGLNMQALHHILPTISACHLREMFPAFREVCKKHGVVVKEAGGWGEFFGGFVSWVTELSKQEPDYGEFDDSQIVSKEKTN